MSRTFTPEEANEALVELRPIVERMVQHRRNLTAAQLQQAELVTRIAGSRGDFRVRRADQRRGRGGEVARGRAAGLPCQARRRGRSPLLEARRGRDSLLA